MDFNKSQKEVEQIAGTHLGKSTVYENKYDKSLLVRFPRSSSLDSSNVDINKSYHGCDVWNMWEVSFLLDNGVPIHGVGKLNVPGNTPYIVESKSMKLYMFGYSNEKMGATIEEAISNLEERVCKDLKEQYLDDVEFTFFYKPEKLHPENSTSVLYDWKQFDLSNLVDLANVKIDAYNETPELIEFADLESNDEKISNYMYPIKSNCKVTKQADYAVALVCIKSEKFKIVPESLLKYLISFRNEDHFHEECCHMIYDRLTDKIWSIDPKADVGVILLYTRRGGIDINPARYSSYSMLRDEVFGKAFMNIDDMSILTNKTFQQ